MPRPRATKPVEFETSDGQLVQFRARKHKIAPSKRSEWQKYFAKVSKDLAKRTKAKPGTKSYGTALRRELAKF